VALVRINVSDKCIAPMIRVTADKNSHAAKKYVVPSSPILDTLIMEAIRLGETSVSTRSARRNIPEDAILGKSPCEGRTSRFHDNGASIESRLFLRVNWLPVYITDLQCCYEDTPVRY
jgi:hypothetical protein